MYRWHAGLFRRWDNVLDVCGWEGDNSTTRGPGNRMPGWRDRIFKVYQEATIMDLREGFDNIRCLVFQPLLCDVDRLVDKSIVNPPFLCA